MEATVVVSDFVARVSLAIRRLHWQLAEKIKKKEFVLSPFVQVRLLRVAHKATVVHLTSG
jgi:hypothetical protein